MCSFMHVGGTTLPACRSPFPSKILASATPSSQHANETLFMQMAAVAFLPAPARVMVCLLNFGKVINSKHGSRKRPPPFPPPAGSGEQQGGAGVPQLARQRSGREIEMQTKKRAEKYFVAD